MKTGSAPIARLIPIFATLLGLFNACGVEPAGTGADSSLIASAYAQEARDSQQQGAGNIYESRHSALTRAIAMVSPAVVGINVTQVKNYRATSPFLDDPFWRQFFRGRYQERIYRQEVKSLGSGFIISEDGYIITNQHVVENAVEIVVALTDGRHLEAEKVGEDHDTDIALLKIEGSAFPYAKMGRSDDLIVGEWAIAIGNPFGLFDLNDKPTVTVGVISALDRDWGRTNKRLYDDMIQTDAAINHGNSGGPLVNSLGEVIGMNTFIYTGSQSEQGFVGIGFAIPVAKITEIVAELRAGGKVNREYRLGIVSVQDLNPYIVRALGLTVNSGVIVSRLENGGPAEKAGLREEDVIIAVEGRPIASRDELIRELRNHDLKVGTLVSFRIVRNNKQMGIQIKLEARE